MNKGIVYHNQHEQAIKKVFPNEWVATDGTTFIHHSDEEVFKTLLLSNGGGPDFFIFHTGGIVHRI